MPTLKRGQPSNTEEALILAAERCFARDGIRSVSLRSIVAAAGQRNASAAHYYFRSKEGLVEAVLLHRTTLVNARRRRLYSETISKAHEEVDLVGVAVMPLAEEILAQPGEAYYLRFLSRIFAEGEYMPVLYRHPAVTEPLKLTMDALDKMVSAKIPDEVRKLRLGSLMRLLVNELAPIEAVSSAKSELALKLEIYNVIDFLTAGLLAPVSRNTADLLKRLGD
jgi:AcrR family transcriptional regulator